MSMYQLILIVLGAIAFIWFLIAMAQFGAYCGRGD